MSLRSKFKHLKKTRLRLVFSTCLSVIRNQRKNTYSCLNYYLNSEIKKPYSDAVVLPKIRWFSTNLDKVCFGFNTRYTPAIKIIFTIGHDDRIPVTFNTCFISIALAGTVDTFPGTLALETSSRMVFT